MKAEQRLFDLLQPEIRNQRLEFDKSASTFVVDIRKMPLGVAQELRNLLAVEYPFLTLIKLDSLRTRPADSEDAFIELIIWRYYQHFDVVFSSTSVKEEFVLALLSLFEKGYQIGSFGVGVIAVDVEDDHPILKLAELFALNGGQVGFFKHRGKTRLLVDDDVIDSSSNQNTIIEN